MLNELKLKNPELEILDVNSKEFASYGRIIEGVDISEIIAEAKKIENKGSGSNYVPSLEAFEKLQ